MQPVTARLSRRPEGQPRVSISGDRLVVLADALFEDEKLGSLRRLLALAFSLPEIGSASVQEKNRLVSFSLETGADPNRVWRRLGTLLRQAQEPERPRALRADRLPLRPPAPGLPVQVSRFGQTLTTFRVRTLDSERLRIGHPLLRDRDVRSRAADSLRTVHGVLAVRSVPLWGSVTILYDAQLVSPEHLLRFLDGSWSSLLQGPLAPALPRKLAVTATLLAFSFTAQFLRRALLPWAAAAVLLFNSPNVIAAVRDLRRRQVGLPAMHTLGFSFLLWFRLPFVSSLFSTLAQLWPALANRLAIQSENQLFLPQRRRQVWARLHDGQESEIEIDVAMLRPGTMIVVRRGEYIPADGTVVEGVAAVQESLLVGGSGFMDKLLGDPVYAGAYVGDGNITIRVKRTGNATASAALARSLPRRPVNNLPSYQDVERVGNRNARPALLAAIIMLMATRMPRHSQVIIRPDFLTAPRLSAHLSALEAIDKAFSGGALIRNPAALDRLLAADICVLDDSLNLSDRQVRFSCVLNEDPGDANEALRLAYVALAGSNDLRLVALKREMRRRRIVTPRASDYRRVAGAISFQNQAGSEICVTAPALALEQGLYPATGALADALKAEANIKQSDPAIRSLAVARSRKLLGLVKFERNGPLEAADAVAALRLELPDTRFVFLSSLPQETAELRAAELGLDAVFGGLTTGAKTDVMRSLSARVAWIGNGTDPRTAATRAAAAVSVSTAGIEGLSKDQADIVLLNGDLLALLAVRLAAEQRLGQLRADYRIVYLANLTAIAGGFVAGFRSLEAGLTSNLGTAAVLLSRWRAMRNITRRNGKR